MNNSLQILSKLSVEHLRKKHPSFPEHALPKTKYKDTSANGLTRCIIDFINFNGGIAERIGNTGRYIKGETVIDVIGISRSTNGKYIPGTGTNGTADISATVNGKSLKVEVKIGRDKMSNDQSKYKERIEQAGGLYFVARDFASFLEWYRTMFQKEGGCHE